MMRMRVTVAVHVQVMLLLLLLCLVQLIRSPSPSSDSSRHKSVAIAVGMMRLVVSRAACVVEYLGRLRGNCCAITMAIAIGIGIALDEALRANKNVIHSQLVTRPKAGGKISSGHGPLVNDHKIALKLNTLILRQIMPLNQPTKRTPKHAKCQVPVVMNECT